MNKNAIVGCALTILAVAGAMIVSPAVAAPRPGSGAEIVTAWGSTGGMVSVYLDPSAMASLGITSGGRAVNGDWSLTIDSGSSNLRLDVTNGEMMGLSGSLQTQGEQLLDLHLQAGDAPSRVGNLDVTFSGRRFRVTDALEVQRELFQSATDTTQVEFSEASSSITITAALVVAPSFAIEVLHNPAAAGMPIGTLQVQSSAGLVDYQAHAADEPHNDGMRTTGPDVTVGDITGDSAGQPQSYVTGPAAIYAYSVGTTSCNVGSMPLQWLDNVASGHPVITQGAFRYRVVNGAGRFEQIGQAWCKHGFCALQGTICSGCTPYCGNCCDHLGVGCSDPYTAGRNGTFDNLGPKSQVNAATGTFPEPHGLPSGSTSLRGRLQINSADVDPAQNSGALYYVECMYTANDDDMAGNDTNNASYRRITFNNDTRFSMNFVAGNAVHRQEPGINAWKVNDAAVTLVIIDISGDGRMILGYKVTDLGNGTWHYEYALENIHSDRSAQFFDVPSSPCVSITNTGFHDVFYHSGEPYDGTDWPVSVTSGDVNWATTPVGTNVNANALRWATLYNFRFDANTPPVDGNVKIGLFKTGSPTFVLAAAKIPGTITVTVNPGSVSDGYIGAPYSQSFSGGGGVGPYTFAVTHGALPAGLSLSSGGVLSGTPTDAAGNYDFIVTATDANGCSGSQSYTLTLNICPAGDISPATLPDAPIGQAYSQALSGVGGTGPYTFAVTAGSTPSGLSLSSGGALTGTPDGFSGTINFTVTRTDSVGCTADHAYSIVVACSIPGDVNNDGFTDGLDLQGVADCFMNTAVAGEYCGCADMDGDGDVDDVDTETLIELLINLP